MGTGYASTVHTTAKVGSLTITAANVKVEGVYCTGTVNPRANYITLERCRIDGGVVLNSGYTAQYLTVRQCMVNERIDGLGSTSTNSMGWTIENCIIRASVSSNAPVMELYNPVIRNNYLRNSSTSTSSSYSYVLKEISGGIIQNNILLANVKERVLLNVSNSTVQNNVMSCPSTTYASSYPDNVCLDMANGDAESKVFAKTGNDMNYYRLADESPAKGAGIDGADCGPFAGAYPYAVYGYPYGMPYFTGSEIGVRAVDGKVSVKQTVVIQND